MNAMADEFDLFRPIADEIFLLSGVSKERNPSRYVECLHILKTRLEELDSAVRKEKCSLQERNALWAKQQSDLVLHLESLLFDGHVLP